MKTALLIIIALAGLARVAEAYPQFQLVRDQTCTGCHLSPAGGGLLNENGLAQSEGISQFGTDPGFFYSTKGAPGGRLVLGGDVRAFGGYYKWGGVEDQGPLALPMQLDFYGRLKLAEKLFFTATVGFRPAEATNEAATYVWSREHFITWQQNPDENYGLYVRAGRFMPVFGLRFAEHPMYTKRWGGNQLYADTYGVSVSQVKEKMEFHVSAFMDDPLIDPIEHATGVAAYGEYRLSEKMSVGLEGMYKSFTNGEFLGSGDFSSDYQEFRIGATQKTYLSGPDVLIQTELQFVNGLVDKVNRSQDSAVGGAPKGLVGALVVSRMFGPFLADVALQHYDSNLRIKNLDKDAADVNVHWFTTSHVELILNFRYEMSAFGAGGESGMWTLLQAHYRM
jgi:hypothetical protein